MMQWSANVAGRCPRCFEAVAEGQGCPHCGSGVEAASPFALRPGTVLADHYVVGGVLGRPGGFGITYLGWDRRLDTRVAVKEFFQRDWAGRGDDRTTIHAYGAEEASLFEYGLAQFLEEGRTLARFDHPNIVRVRNFLQANGTGYLVMDYYPGQSLASFLDSQPGSRVAPGLAVKILQPVLDGLRTVHATGVLHRDIDPHNIYLTSGGRVVLLDFGAARQALGQRSKSLSIILKPGYAPYEQYASNGRQGPWTDVYGCAATLYRMVTGVAPLDAPSRVMGEPMPSAHALNPAVPAALGATLDRALAIQPGERPQSVEFFQHELLRAVGGAEPPAVRSHDAGHGAIPSPTPPPVPPAAPHPAARVGSSGWRWAAAGVALLLVLGLGWAFGRVTSGTPTGTGGAATSGPGTAGGGRASEPPIGGLEIPPRDRDAAPNPPRAAVVPGWMGVSLADVDAVLARVAGLSSAQGSYATGVVPSSPAAAADLRVGDILISVNGDGVRDARHFTELVSRLGAGAQASIGVMRGSNYQSLNVRLLERPTEEQLRSRYPPSPTSVQAVNGPLAPSDFEVARWTEVPFYPGTQLWEFGRRGHDALAAYLVPQDGAPIVLDGKSPQIHAYNARSRLNVTNSVLAAHYLRFFCAFVWGEGGPFQVIEERWRLPTAVRSDAKVPVAAVVPQSAGEAFEAKAIVFYETAVFETRFRIERTGMVEMLDDTPLLTNLQTEVAYRDGQRRPRDLRSLKVENWPLPPPVSGAWKNATDAEVYRVRQLILSDRAR